MPFTPSHAAAALPFLRTPLPAAALVLGTMAPDLPYYAPLGIPRGLTHSLVGAVTIDPILALAALALWWAVLREPVVDLAPGAVRERIPPRPAIGRGARAARTVALALAAALIGIATHLAWDWFTHPDGLASVLPLWSVRLGPLEVYRWLQHASSVAGAIILAVWGVRWLRRTPRSARSSWTTQRMRRVAWASVAGAWLVLAVAVWTGGMIGGSTPFAPPLVFRVAVVSIGGAAALAVLICLAWHVRRAQVGRGPRAAAG